jgi:uncharacterized membrane protein
MAETRIALPPGTMPKYRVEALADGMFAVVMTLLILDIKLPEIAPPATDPKLLTGLFDIKSKFLTYLVSFMVLGAYWLGHHFQLHHVQAVNRTLLWINLGFLLAVTFIPFSTSFMAEHTGLLTPLVVYAGNLMLLGLFLFVHISYLHRHPALAANFSSAVFRAIVRRIYILIAIPVTSVAVGLVSPRLSILVYFGLLVAFRAPSKAVG